jgi:tRNA-dihydrouridine synthase B
MNPSLFVKIIREKQLLLPPLSGYTDYPFRMVLASFHPPFLITEMANARAILQKNRRTMQILKIAQGNHFNGIQLVGSSPEYMRKAANIVQGLGFDYIDINMGCTARKVACRGEGISLMKQEQRACDIVKAVSETVDIPVSCKLRLGLSKHSINVLSFSQRLVDAGAIALTIHGRSGEKKFGSPLDLNVIRNTAAALSVPVIANGGIYTGNDAKRVIQTTGVAAVMPGRGLVGNPWLVPEILGCFSHKQFTPPTLEEKKTVCRMHLDLLVEFYGERRAILRMRSILPHYFSSCMFLKEVKKEVQQIHSTKEIHQLLERITNNGPTLIYQT